MSDIPIDENVCCIPLLADFELLALFGLDLLHRKKLTGGKNGLLPNLP